MLATKNHYIIYKLFDMSKVFTTLDKNKNRPWNEVLLHSFQGLLLDLYLLIRLNHFALLRINDVAL